MAGERYRLVTETSRGERTERVVSGLVLTGDEARDMITVEQQLHLASGWVLLEEDDDRIVLERRKPKHSLRRTIHAQVFGPLDDS